MTLAETILQSRAAHADQEKLEAFLAGSVEGMLGEDLEWWRGPRIAKTSELYADFVLRLRENFLIENLVSPAVDNHVDALLGDEIDWTLTQGGRELKAESEALKRWYYDRGVQRTLYDAGRSLQYAVSAGRGVSMLRCYVPRRALTEGGVPRGPLVDKLRQAVRLEHPKGGRCGALTEDGDPYACWYLYAERAGTETRSVLELSALDSEFERQGWSRLRPARAAGLTVVQLRTGPEWETILGEAAYPQGGHLTMFEMARPPLVTADVTSQQAGLNTQWTYLNKHAAGAAFLERIFTNALPPGRWVNARGEPDPKGEIYEPQSYQVGAGQTNFISGQDDKDGNPMNVGVHFREPSSSETMLANIREHRYAILNAVNQLHRLIAGDATATGVARVQAAHDFMVSLRPSEQQLKLAAKWAFESALRLAGYFETGGPAYQEAAFDVTLSVRSVPLTPEERRQVIAEHQAGAIDQQEMMRLLGVKDTAAMAKRVTTERAERLALLPKPENSSIINTS